MFFASGVETAGPFIDTCSNEHVILQPVSQSRFDPFNLSCTPFWPSVGDWCRWGNFCQLDNEWIGYPYSDVILTRCKTQFNGIGALFSLLPRAVDRGTILFQASRSNLNFAQSALSSALETSLSSVSLKKEMIIHDLDFFVTLLQFRRSGFRQSDRT